MKGYRWKDLKNMLQMLGEISSSPRLRIKTNVNFSSTSKFWELDSFRSKILYLGCLDWFCSPILSFLSFFDTFQLFHIYFGVEFLWEFRSFVWKNLFIWNYNHAFRFNGINWQFSWFVSNCSNFYSLHFRLCWYWQLPVLWLHQLQSHTYILHMQELHWPIADTLPIHHLPTVFIHHFTRTHHIH